MSYQSNTPVPFDYTALTWRQPVQEMTWGEATRRYLFCIREERRAAILAAMTTVFWWAIRFIPWLVDLLISLVLVADDATVVGVVDDVAIPWMAIMLLISQLIWASMRIGWIHHQGNKAYKKYMRQQRRR